jgi:hypothetical protein
MQVLAAELAAARSLGRDEGANAMEVLVQRLTEHMGKMYQEGQGLQNQCAQLKADFQAEMEKAAVWYKEQLQEAKKTGDAWASDYKADLDRKFVNEREELRSKMQQEHEALQQRLRLSDKTSSDTAQQKWDEIKREMTEKFNQQRREYQEDFSRKNAETMEEYRKKCDTTWHASLAQEVEKSRKAHEENFLSQAHAYRDALTADLTRRGALLDERAEKQAAERTLFLGQQSGSSSNDKELAKIRK